MEWRPIPEYEGYYEISEFGDVRGIERIVIRKDGIKMFVKPRTISPYYTKDGYLRLVLTKNSKAKHHLVHRLVARTFLDVPDNYLELEVNHIDEDKENNYYKNLEWCTHVNNMRHSPWINKKIYDANKMAVIAINPLGERFFFESIKDMANELDITIPTAHTYVQKGNILSRGKKEGWQFIYDK